MEKVSVCIATYNGAQFVRQQIDSILPQLNSEDEITISDDGSTDETLSIILSYDDNRFRIIENARTGSPSKSFERGLAHCSGDYIFLSDQDDIWMPAKVETMKRFLRAYDLVLSDCSVINNKNEVLIESFFEHQKSKKGFAQNLIRNSFMGCCMAFNRKVLKSILPFPGGVISHDQWIGLIAERSYNVHFLDEPLVQYRRHGNNYSLTSEKSTRNFFEKVNYRIQMLYNIYTR